MATYTETIGFTATDVRIGLNNGNGTFGTFLRLDGTNDLQLTRTIEVIREPGDGSSQWLIVRRTTNVSLSMTVGYLSQAIEALLLNATATSSAAYRRIQVGDAVILPSFCVVWRVEDAEGQEACTLYALPNAGLGGDIGKSFAVNGVTRSTITFEASGDKTLKQGSTTRRLLYDVKEYLDSTTLPVNVTYPFP